MKDIQRKEWLTREIVKEYQSKASCLRDDRQDIGELRKMKLELMDRCGITEIEALNILNGYNTTDYIRKYEILSGKVILEKDDKKKVMERYLLEEMADMETKLQEQRMIMQDLLD